MPHTYMRTWPGSSGAKVLQGTRQRVVDAQAHGSSGQPGAAAGRRAGGCGSGRQCLPGFAARCRGYNRPQYIAPCPGRLSHALDLRGLHDARPHLSFPDIAAPAGPGRRAARRRRWRWPTTTATSTSCCAPASYAEALAKADQYLAGKPRDPQMRFLKGVVLTESGRTGDAIATFTKLTEDYPELPEPYNNLAVLYAGQSQFDKARAALEMAIRTNPSYATAHENLGDVYAKLASQAYSKALQLDAGNTGGAAQAGADPRAVLAAGARGARPPPRPRRGSPPAAAAAAPAPAAARRAGRAPAAPARRGRARRRRSGRRACAGRPRPRPPPPRPPARRQATSKPPSTPGPPPGRPRTWPATSAPTARNSIRPATSPRKAWEEERRARIVGKSTICVRVSRPVGLGQRQQGHRALPPGLQRRRLNVTSRKTLELVKTGDRWTDRARKHRRLIARHARAGEGACS